MMLKDTTFLIPVRIDSKQRLENLYFIIDYILSKVDTNIIVQESDSNQKVSNLPCEYTFEYDTNNYFHKTKILNNLCRMAKTPIIVSYDCDVLLEKARMIQSAELIREGYDVVYPHTTCVRINRSHITKIKSTGSLTNISGKIYEWDSRGGCTFFNRESFIEGGMANEYFKSWGHEDVEIYERFTKLDYKIERLEGLLYHIDHTRDISNYRTMLSRNEKHLNLERNMSKEELLSFMNEWNWL